MKKFFIVISLTALIILNLRINCAENVLMTAAKEELKRNMSELSKEELPPYFLSYGITETNSIKLSSSFGKIITDINNETRLLDIDLRVGDHQFDNSHLIRGASFSFGGGRGAVQLPLDNDKNSFRNAIWYATDKEYKEAIEKYKKALTNRAVKVKEEDTSADFSYEKPQQYSEKIVKFDIDANYWKERIKRLSALFSQDEKIYVGSVSFTSEVLTKYFISSEGTEIQTSQPFIRMFIYAKTKADDGMSLPLYRSYFAFNDDELPDENKMKSDLLDMMNTLKKLRNAPLMTTFSGPAILSGEASGVFFHEIFGHRVEGHRMKNSDNAQTYKNSVGEEILPEFIDVTFDPTIKILKGYPLSGYYEFDDEGIKAQKAEVVKDGILKDFLMSRSPIENFTHSNGHGRRQAGYQAVSRQSNLIVSVHEKMSVAKLKEKLREECKKDNKEFGLYFEKVQGGFTFTGRTIPNSFNVNPLIVYKVFADGRPDELVRGVDLIGTPLTTFSNIIAGADDIGVFNGTCGAESGGVPVSACSPSLLVSKIEVQKKSKSQAKPPILPAPDSEETE